MKNLIRIKRKSAREYTFFIDGLRREPLALPGRAFSEEIPYLDGCDYFLVESGMDTDIFVQAVAELNPGCDIEVYALTAVGHCPAGEFAKKRVTEDGILPA